MKKISELPEGSYIAIGIKNSADYEFIIKDDVKTFVAENSERIIFHKIEGKYIPSLWETKKVFATFKNADISECLDDFEYDFGYEGFSEDCYNSMSDTEKATVCRIFNDVFQKYPIYSATDVLISLD